MIKILSIILVSSAAALLSLFGAYNYLPLSSLDILQSQKLGNATSITTINGTDTLSSSRTVINNNFSSLNTNKLEISALVATTSLPNLAGVGTILSGVWNGTIITPIYGGTGSSTLAANQILLGNGSSQIGVVNGLGSSGQFLTSQGSGVAPTWTTSALDLAGIYAWTGQHTFSAATGFGTSSPGTWNTLAVEGNALLSGTTTVEHLKFSTTSPLIAYSDGGLVLPTLTGASAGQQLQLIDASTGETAWQSPSGGLALEIIDASNLMGVATRTSLFALDTNTTFLATMFEASLPFSVSKISIHPTGVDISGKVELGLYSVISGTVTKVLSLVTGTISASGWQTFSTTTTAFNPGNYYFAAIPISTTNLDLKTYATDEIGGCIGSGFTPSGEPKISLAQTSAEAGVLPDTFDETSGTCENQIIFRLDN